MRLLYSYEFGSNLPLHILSSSTGYTCSPQVFISRQGQGYWVTRYVDTSMVYCYIAMKKQAMDCTKSCKILCRLV